MSEFDKNNNIEMDDLIETMNDQLIDNKKKRNSVDSCAESSGLESESETEEEEYDPDKRLISVFLEHTTNIVILRRLFDL